MYLEWRKIRIFMKKHFLSSSLCFFVVIQIKNNRKKAETFNEYIYYHCLDV